MNLTLCVGCGLRLQIILEGTRNIAPRTNTTGSTSFLPIEQHSDLRLQVCSSRGLQDVEFRPDNDTQCKSVMSDSMKSK
jgi:hypothetical protein